MDARRFIPAAVVVTGALALGAGGAAHGAVSAGAGSSEVTGASVVGRLTQTGGQPLPGMSVQALPTGAAACTSAAGCVSTYTRPGGGYTLTPLAAGAYDIDVVDGSSTVTVAHVQVPTTTSTVRRPLRLGPAAVPAGITARHARRDLAWLNAERARDGLPGPVVENPRWSQECAAHDAYEAANGVLQATENPAAPGASDGGAWAGRSADLAQGGWTAAATPWETAPVHLLALLAPSLSVTGIDDSGTLQCAVTFPGMLRPAPAHDTLTTVPADGATGVPPSELARESPFTPVQFAGLPTDRPTGRELFVYLNRTATVGQSPVQITSATLSRGGRSVGVRVVDSTTRTIGPYLAGGIIIPVAPLAAATTYRATVTVADAGRTLTRRWTFTTRATAAGQSS